jgi:hypothetical protein
MFCFDRPDVVNRGANVTLRQRTGKRIAAAQQFSSGETAAIPGTTQIVPQQRKISNSEVVRR